MLPKRHSWINSGDMCEEILSFRVQYLLDTDPFCNLSAYPVPSRAPVFSFVKTAPLSNQLGSLLRLLNAPQRVRDALNLKLDWVSAEWRRWSERESWLLGYFFSVGKDEKFFKLFFYDQFRFVATLESVKNKIVQYFVFFNSECGCINNLFLSYTSLSLKNFSSE